MKKEEWILRGNELERKFRSIAETLGKEHPLVTMMGELAWGRHNWELGVAAYLEQAIKRVGALEGYFEAMNIWARDNQPEAQRVMLKIWYGGERV